MSLYNILLQQHTIIPVVVLLHTRCQDLLETPLLSI